MDESALIAIAAQVPLVVAFITAVQKKWIYIGSNVRELIKEFDDQLADKQKQIDNLRQIHQQRLEEMKSYHQEELAAANARADRERADRIAADERTAKMSDSLREATEVMSRSVALHEQAILGAGRNAARPRRA